MWVSLVAFPDNLPTSKAIHWHLPLPMIDFLHNCHTGSVVNPTSTSFLFLIKAGSYVVMPIYTCICTQTHFIINSYILLWIPTLLKYDFYINSFLLPLFLYFSLASSLAPYHWDWYKINTPQILFGSLIIRQIPIKSKVIFKTLKKNSQLNIETPKCSFVMLLAITIPFQQPHVLYNLENSITQSWFC